MTSPRDERPTDLGDVPAQEGIEPADAADRVGKDPAEQRWDNDRQEPDIVVDDASVSDG